MENNFFIMMYHPTAMAMAMPITHGESENVFFFKTEDHARDLAENHDACQAFGYEIFEMGMGN